MTPLCKLAYKYCTDKGVGRAIIGHSYTQYYYNLFRHMQYSVKKVLELGTGCPRTMRIEGYKSGGGLRMWRDFFTNAQVYGADIRGTSLFTDERIETFLCDVTKEDELLKLLEKTGTDLDIVIDDASHKYQDQITSARILLPLLKDDVTYIIEDIKHMTPVAHALRHYDIFEPVLPDRRSKDDRLLVINKKCVGK